MKIFIIFVSFILIGCFAPSKKRIHEICEENKQYSLLAYLSMMQELYQNSELTELEKNEMSTNTLLVIYLDSENCQK